MYNKSFHNILRFPFLYFGKISIKLNHKNTILKKKNCFDCANDLIDLKQP